MGHWVIRVNALDHDVTIQVNMAGLISILEYIYGRVLIWWIN